MSGPTGTASCEAFIEALGLKTIFSALMAKLPKNGHVNINVASEDTAHALGIVSSLFSNLDSETPGRVRLLAKFVEGNYEKVDKMLDLRDSSLARLKIVDVQIEMEKQARYKLCIF